MAIAQHFPRQAFLFGVGLAVSAALAMADEPATERAAGPWESSHLLYTHSQPAIHGQWVERIIAGEENLALISHARAPGVLEDDEPGLSTFRWDGQQWQPQQTSTRPSPLGAAWVGPDRLLELTDRGVYLTDTQEGGRRLLINEPADDEAAAARIPGADRALVVIGRRGWLIDLEQNRADELRDVTFRAGPTEMVQAGEPSRLFICNDRRLLVWNDEEYAPEPWRDADGEALRFPESAFLTASPQGQMIYAGTRGAGLWAVDLEAGQVHQRTTDDLPHLDSDLIYRRVGLDAERDTLYVPTWREIAAIAPASDPAQWRVVGYLSPVLEPYLYSRKRAAPAGDGIVHLPQSDELVIAGRWGATVMSPRAESALVHDMRFEQFDTARSAIPGQGRLYDFMRQEKLRSVWTRSISEEAIDAFEQGHINTMFKQVFYYGHTEFWSDFEGSLEARLRRTAELAEDRDMALVVSARPVGTTSMNHSGVIDYDYRHWVLANGQTAAYDELRDVPHGQLLRAEFPCPMDEGYWERSLAPLMDLTAELAQSYPAIKGFQLELGDGYGPSNFNPRGDTCYCDVCWQRFLDQQRIGDAQAREASAEAGQRLAYLREHGLRNQYKHAQGRHLAEVAQRFVEQARQIDPELGMLLALPETSTEYDSSWWYRGFLRGFGTPDMPVIASSQQDYAAPYNPHLVHLLEQRFNEAGKHTLMVPGLALLWYTPQQAAQLMREKVRRSPGVFVYNMQGSRWSGQSRNENLFRPLIGNGRTFTRQDYLDALSQMELELD